MPSRKRSNGAVKKKPAAADFPDVGKILTRLREQRKVSVRELAAQSGLSESFVRAVERGDSDISLGRLARLAAFFEYDLGSFLGFTAHLSKPSFVRDENRTFLNRGKGIEYEALRLPGIDLDFLVVKLAPHAKFRNALMHEGLDVIYVVSGEIVQTVDGVDYPMAEGQCCVYSAAYPHKARNDSNRPAFLISLTTGKMY